MCGVEAGSAGKRVLFAYALPTRHEFSKHDTGVVPSHRLWGAAELQKRGWCVECCPDAGDAWKLLGASGWRLWQSFWAIRESKDSLGIVAVHEAGALFLLLARRAGLLRKPVLVLNMALLHPRNLRWGRRMLWKWLLGGAEAVVSLVQTQSDRVSALFGVSRARTVFLPLGVDPDFLGRADPADEERFCLAVGTNDGKDFETLVEALPLRERLIVVTDGYNAEKVRNHPCFGAGIEVRTAVPALELRDLYRRAAVVVVPLADTSHGSGHTVLLETMAMGKIVVVSASRNMEGYIQNSDNALVVPVGDTVAMRAALLDALDCPERHSEMRERAAQLVRARFGIERFGSELGRILDSLHTGAPPRARDGREMSAKESRKSETECRENQTREERHASVP